MITVKAECWKTENGGMGALFYCPHCDVKFNWDSTEVLPSQNVICGEDEFSEKMEGCGKVFRVEIDDPYK